MEMLRQPIEKCYENYLDFCDRTMLVPNMMSNIRKQAASKCGTNSNKIYCQHYRENASLLIMHSKKNGGYLWHIDARFQGRKFLSIVKESCALACTHTCTLSEMVGFSSPPFPHN